MAFTKVELFIPGQMKNEPVFYYIIKEFNVIPTIIEASFSTELGWAIVKLEGKELDIDRLIDFLRDKGVEVNIR